MRSIAPGSTPPRRVHFLQPLWSTHGAHAIQDRHFVFARPRPCREGFENRVLSQNKQHCHEAGRLTPLPLLVCSGLRPSRPPINLLMSSRRNIPQDGKTHPRQRTLRCGRPDRTHRHQPYRHHGRLRVKIHPSLQNKTDALTSRFGGRSVLAPRCEIYFAHSVRLRLNSTTMIISYLIDFGK